MPPIKSVPQSITSLSDQDLANKLLELGVTLGPILPTTRGVYERKLYQLQSGEKLPPASNYAPVDDDDEEPAQDSEDEEITIQQPDNKPRYRTTIRQQPNPSTSAVRQTPTPERSAVRRPSPRRPLHTTTDDKSSMSFSQTSTPAKSKGGIPFWVKLLAIAIVALVVFLVIKNMEADPASKVPAIDIDV